MMKSLHHQSIKRRKLRTTCLVTISSFLFFLFYSSFTAPITGVSAFLRPIASTTTATSYFPSTCTLRLSAETTNEEKSSTPSKDNKAMAFLRKIGRVGGDKVDYANAIGVDEGSSTKTAAKWGRSKAMKKAKNAYRSCTDSGKRKRFEFCGGKCVRANLN
jgi:hypothetical protein